MSEIIVNPDTKRIRFDDQQHILQHARKQNYSLLVIIFFIITAILFWYFIFYSHSTSTETSLIVPTVTPTPIQGLFSTQNKYRAVHSQNQLQIYNDQQNLIFKLYDQSDENIPIQWIKDIVLIYKNNSRFGLILNDKNQFFANPNLVSDSSCSNYAISPDQNKIIFFGTNSTFCSGTLIDFSIPNQSRYKNISPQNKNQNLNQTVENAFWDSDSKSVNVTLKDKFGKLSTKIIPL